MTEDGRGRATLPHLTNCTRADKRVHRRNHAAAYVYGRSITGFPAWMLWLTIHLWYLIGFRNRLLVLINWARTYFFRERAACRILPSEPTPPARVSQRASGLDEGEQAAAE